MERAIQLQFTTVKITSLKQKTPNKQIKKSTMIGVDTCMSMLFAV